jgi:hypothetical protein
MRDTPDGYAETKEWSDPRYAEDDEDGARALIFLPQGQQRFVEGRLSRYDTLNPTVAAKNFITRTKDRRAELGREDDRLERACRWTRRTITATTRERIGKRRPFLQGLQALAFLLLAIFTLWVSTAVISLYVVGSGSDLFAAHPQDAVWFAVTAILAAGGIKAFEKQLITDRARHVYRSIFFTIGIGAFVVWSVMAAIAFAPDASGGRAWLTGASSGNTTTIALVLTHLLSDVAWGYLLFSAAEEWLSGNYKRAEIENPRYRALCDARSAITRQLDASDKAIDAAEEHLEAVAAGRRETAVMAEATFARAYQLWEQAEAQARAVRRGEFLTFINPEK